MLGNAGMVVTWNRAELEIRGDIAPACGWVIGGSRLQLIRAEQDHTPGIGLGNIMQYRVAVGAMCFLPVQPAE